MAVLTERLRLCLPVEQEAAALQDFYWRNRRHLCSWEPKRDDFYYTELFWKQELLLRKRRVETGTGLSWTLHEGGSVRIVGICNFSNIVRGAFQACHLGYAIDEEKQGLGYMKEALNALIPIMFEEYRMHRIMANYMPENNRSASVLESLGFEIEGKARAYLEINGRWEDHTLTALVNPNW
ncbi:GNAT family N-acetyltransferase [Pokkaliibacter sp. CJK22405]|uniref:GNAT family N-acetyltransferase n=1 Tax=Pokkaliibacter sp. CJK22405 TaxID=3384615 RepID=UPI0039850389